MKVAELIEALKKYDPALEIEVSTGHEERGSRFYGSLYRVSKREDHRGERILLTGKLQED